MRTAKVARRRKNQAGERGLPGPPGPPGWLVCKAKLVPKEYRGSGVKLV
jgi:hypothetical protein